MNELSTACDDECDRDNDVDDNDMFIVMTTCFLLSYLVQIASSITLTANTLMDDWGLRGRGSGSTVPSEMENFERPPNGENSYAPPGFVIFLVFLFSVGTLYATICYHTYYNVSGSDANPRIAKHRHQQQQSTTVAAKRECF